MGDQACPTSVLAPIGGGEYPHDRAVEFEIDLGCGRRPACSRIPAGIVTWPLDVMRIAIPHSYMYEQYSRRLKARNSASSPPTMSVTNGTRHGERSEAIQLFWPDAGSPRRCAPRDDAVWVEGSSAIRPTALTDRPQTSRSRTKRAFFWM